MIYHYCRVSTRDQNLDRQTSALNRYKQADRVYCDKMSGKNFDRTAYAEMKNAVLEGDEVIIKELDRLGRNKEDTKKELEWFKSKGVTVRILDLPTTLCDFSGAEWVKDMVNNVLIEVLGAIAEQERNKIHQRMMEGLQAKKDRGEWDDYGRPPARIDEDLFRMLRERHKRKELTVAECCKELGISKTTWYEKIKQQKRGGTRNEDYL